jgi:glycosyltransferase involved in cell wall biosynthesis
MARFALEPPLAGLPFVLDMVDVDSEKWATLGASTRGPRGWIYRREAILLRQFERIASNAADTTLVVNERERQSLTTLGVTTRVDVVPNGVDLSSFRPPSAPAAQRRVVFCGVMNYEPNEAAALWLAREVWPRVMRARSDARLTLLGANPTRRVLQLAHNDPSIEVTGSVADVRPILWQSAISVAPLFVARGVQNKVLEAVAAGLPTVVSRAVLDGLPMEVAPACIQAGTAAEWANEITRLLAVPPDQRRALAGRATLEPLAWARRLDVLEDILHTAASTRRIA